MGEESDHERNNELERLGELLRIEEPAQPQIGAMTYEEALHHLVRERLEGRARQLYERIMVMERAERGGRVTPAELRQFMKDHGIYMSVEDFAAFRKNYKRLGLSGWSWREFLDFMVEQEYHLRVAFSSVDKDQSGELDFDEVKAALQQLHVNLSDYDIRHMMHHVDKRKEGTINYSEWYDFLVEHQIGSEDTKINIGLLVNVWRQHVDDIILDDGEGIGLPDDDLEVHPSRVPSNDAEDPSVPTYVIHPKWKYLLSATIAASISRTLTSPLDRMRCLLQVETFLQMRGSVGAVASAATRSSNAAAEELSALLKQPWLIVKREGWRALFRGNAAHVAKIVPEVAFRSFFYEHMKAFFTWMDKKRDTPMEMAWYQRFLAATLAAVSAQIVVYPLEYLKTSLQASLVSEKQPNGGFVVLKLAIQKNGFLSIYKGLCPSLIRVAGDVAIYETFKKLHFQYYHNKLDPLHRLPSVPELLLMGTAACTMAQTATYPFFLVRTQLQVQSMPQFAGALKTNSTSTPTYRGMIHAFLSIYQRQGLRGLYHGWTVNLLKTVPSVSLTFVSYELFKREMGIYF
ncbi:hypothetical protein QOT17_023108 [Balamuthia mandrillaris]